MKGISHITLLCQNIEKTAALFKELFDAEEVYSSDVKQYSFAKEKFLLVGSLWFALMEGKPLERSYNHIAFHVEEQDLPKFEEKIQAMDLRVIPGRSRHPSEGKSIYFYDYDNHLFELHTGDLQTRLTFYNNDIA